MKFTRFRILVLVCLALGLLCPSAAIGAEVRSFTGEQAANILKIMEWSVWSEYGKQRDGKVIYMFAEPPSG